MLKRVSRKNGLCIIPGYNIKATFDPGKLTTLVRIAGETAGRG